MSFGGAIFTLASRLGNTLISQSRCLEQHHWTRDLNYFLHISSLSILLAQKSNTAFFSTAPRNKVVRCTRDSIQSSQSSACAHFTVDCASLCVRTSAWVSILGWLQP